MPVVLVSDTSVLVDLERGGFLDSCFLLPFEFAVPDLLYRRELEPMGGAALVARGLRVEELTSEELSAVQRVLGERSKLSLADAYAYTLACTRGWTLLTGDGQLRALAEAAQVPFCGVLWVLDRFYDSGVVEATIIVVGLQTIAAHPRCRLPRAEIDVRLECYGKAKK
jgi:hypothetical protein